VSAQEVAKTSCRQLTQCDFASQGPLHCENYMKKLDTVEETKEVEVDMLPSELSLRSW
jgi:hypothetical protein